MTSRRVLHLASIAAALLLAPVHASASVTSQPTVEVNSGADPAEAAIGPDGRVSHRAAGLVYPLKLADMPLRKIYVYGPADVSAYYTLRGGGNGDPWITFNVYPATISIEAEVAGAEQALVERVAATRIDAPSAPVLNNGRSGWFEGKIEGVNVTTGYLLKQRGGWFLKARFTIPESKDANGIERTLSALADIPWNWAPAPAPSSELEVEVVAAR